MGEYDSECLSLNYLWIMRMVSFAESEFNSSPLFTDPVNSHSGASSAYFGPGTNCGCNNACSSRDIEQCHQWYDLTTIDWTVELVRYGKCKCHPQVSEYQYCKAGRRTKYPAHFIRYGNIQSEMLKQWPTHTVIGLLGFCMSCSSTKHKTVWAG